MTEDKDPMQDALQVLLDRMEACPEEFVKEDTRGVYDTGDKEEYSRFWKVTDMIRRSMRVRANIARDIKDEEPDAEFNDPLWFMSKEEREALYTGIRAALRQTFVTSVMTTLLTPEEGIARSKKEALAAANAAANQLYSYAQIVGASGPPFSGMGTVSGTNAHQAALERQQLDAQRNAMAAQNVYGRRV